MRFFKRNRANVEGVTQALLKKLNVKINAKTIARSLQSHPDYPSLSAVSACLSDLEMAHQTFNFKKGVSSINHLPFPFIVQLNNGREKIVVLNSLENGNATISDEAKENEVITEIEFLKRWTGAVLFAEADEESGEKNYTQNRIKYFFEDATIPLVIFLVLTVFSIVISNQQSAVFLAVFSVKCLKVNGSRH